MKREHTLNWPYSAVFLVFGVFVTGGMQFENPIPLFIFRSSLCI